MVATRVDPISITAPTKNPSGRVLRYVPPPRPGIAVKFSDQKYAQKGFGRPFVDGEGDPVNNGWGTPNSEINNWSRLSYRNATQSWSLKRDLDLSCGNCNWVSADKNKVISWLGEDGNTLESPAYSTQFTARAEPNMYSVGSRFVSPNEGGNPGLTGAGLRSSTWSSNPLPSAFVAQFPLLYTGNTGIIGQQAADGNDEDGCLFSMVNNGVNYENHLSSVEPVVTYPHVLKRSTAIWKDGNILCHASDPALPIEDRYLVLGACLVTDTDDREWIVAVFNAPGTNCEILAYRGVYLEPEEGTELWDGWYLFEMFRPAKISVFNHHGWRFNESGTQARCLYSVPMIPSDYWTQDVTLWTSYRTGRTDQLELLAVFDIDTGGSTVSIDDTTTIGSTYPDWDLDKDDDSLTNPVSTQTAYTINVDDIIESTTVDVPCINNVLCPDIPWDIDSYIEDWPHAQDTETPFRIVDPVSPITTKICVDYEGDTPVYLMGELTLCEHFAANTFQMEEMYEGAIPNTWQESTGCIRVTADEDMARPALFSVSGSASIKSQDQHRYFITGGTRDGQELFNSGINVRIRDVEVDDPYTIGYEENSNVCIPLAVDLRYGIFVYQYADINAHSYKDTGFDMTASSAGVKYYHPVHGTQIIKSLDLHFRQDQDLGVGNVSYSMDHSPLDGRYNLSINRASSSAYSNYAELTGDYTQTGHVANSYNTATTDVDLFTVGYSAAYFVSPPHPAEDIAWDWLSYNFTSTTSGVNPGMSNPQIPNTACGSTFFHVRSDINDKQPMCFCVDPNGDNEFIFSAPLHIMPSIACGFGEFYVPESTILTGFYNNGDWEETERVFYGSQGNDLDDNARPYTQINDTFRVEAIGLV